MREADLKLSMFVYVSLNGEEGSDNSLFKSGFSYICFDNIDFCNNKRDSTIQQKRILAKTFPEMPITCLLLGRRGQKQWKRSDSIKATAHPMK